MERSRSIVISTRIPKETLDEIKRTVGEDYTSESDFFRSAIRSELYKERIKKIRDELMKTKDSSKAVRKLRDLFEKVPDEDYETWVKSNTKDMKG